MPAMLMNHVKKMHFLDVLDFLNVLVHFSLYAIFVRYQLLRSIELTVLQMNNWQTKIICFVHYELTYMKSKARAEDG